MDDAPVLITPAVWANMAIAAKVDLAIAIGTPMEAAQHPEFFAAMPEHSKVWLTGWQMLVNSGSCWNTSGSIGRAASSLIDDGFLLLGKTSTKAFAGSVPGRDEITAGAKGSPGFVLRMMGEAYLAWISAIE